MPAYQQDEEALEHFNKLKRKISQNRLLLMSAVNLLTFALSIFSITYYRWVWVEVINLSSFQQDISPNQLWVNLLYGRAFNSSQYQSFEDLKEIYCTSSDAPCQALFIQFRFIGIFKVYAGLLSFFMFVVAYLLQIRDFWQVFRYLQAANNNSKESQIYKSSLEAKDSFMHLVTILSYSIGLGLNFFSLTLMKLNDYTYGVSFWTFFSSLMVFIVCIIYKNISINRISQQSLMLNLIEGQKKLRKQEFLQDERKSFESSSEFQV